MCHCDMYIHVACWLGRDTYRIHSDTNVYRESCTTRQRILSPATGEEGVPTSAGRMRAGGLEDVRRGMGGKKRVKERRVHLIATSKHKSVPPEPHKKAFFKDAVSQSMEIK